MRGENDAPPIAPKPGRKGKFPSGRSESRAVASTPPLTFGSARMRGRCERWSRRAARRFNVGENGDTPMGFSSPRKGVSTFQLIGSVATFGDGAAAFWDGEGTGSRAQGFDPLSQFRITPNTREISVQRAVDVLVNLRVVEPDHTIPKLLKERGAPRVLREFASSSLECVSPSISITKLRPSPTHEIREKGPIGCCRANFQPLNWRLRKCFHITRSAPGASRRNARARRVSSICDPPHG